MGQVVAGVSVDDLHVGQQVELVVDVLFSDDDVDHLIWKWKPVSGTGTGPDAGPGTEESN